jgi:hypothetical protein
MNPMRKMPTVALDAFGKSIDIPVAADCELQRAIDILVGGNLTKDEQAFVEMAWQKRNWTIRVIVDELREKRGMVPVLYGFDWTSLGGHKK